MISLTAKGRSLLKKSAELIKGTDPERLLSAPPLRTITLRMTNAVTLRLDTAVNEFNEMPGEETDRDEMVAAALQYADLQSPEAVFKMLVDYRQAKVKDAIQLATPVEQ